MSLRISFFNNSSCSRVLNSVEAQLMYNFLFPRPPLFWPSLVPFNNQAVVCLIGRSSGPRPIWRPESPAVPGPGYFGVHAFASHRSSAGEGVQKNCPGPRHHYPRGNHRWDSHTPVAQRSTILELTWTFQTWEVISDIQVLLISTNTDKAVFLNCFPPSPP